MNKILSRNFDTNYRSSKVDLRLRLCKIVRIVDKQTEINSHKTRGREQEEGGRGEGSVNKRKLRTLDCRLNFRFDTRFSLAYRVK